jgi:GDP-mannose 6-dehydrogenase
MLAGVAPSNRVHIEHAINIVLRSGKKSIGMIGLSFKSGTDDLRESPLVELAETFIGKGLTLRIFDPEVQLARLMGANRRYIEESIPHLASLMHSRCEEVIRDAEVLVVGLHDAAILAQVHAHVTPEQLVVDLVHMPEKEKLTARYHGVCW